jgi:hypothetical protein
VRLEQAAEQPALRAFIVDDEDSMRRDEELCQLP